MPWVEADEGRDNFEPLRSMTWQVHMYGEASKEVAEACAARGLALHQFAWGETAERAGLARGAAYLVRPDGYVAWAGVSAGELKNWRV